MNSVLAQLMTGGNNSGFSINNFLNGLQNSLGDWGSVIVTIIGLVMVIIAVFKIAKGLMGGGRGQVNWVLNLLLFFIGGALAFTGGWGLVQTVSGGGEQTLMDIANAGGTPTIIIDADAIYDNVTVGDYVISFTD